MPQVLDPNAPLPGGDFGTTRRRLRYGVLGDEDRPSASLIEIQDAEDVSRSFEQRGWPLFMVLSEDGDPHLGVTTNSFSSEQDPQPPIVEINRRFRSDEPFARAMFGVLDVAGRVFGPRPASGLTFDLIQRTAS